MNESKKRTLTHVASRFIGTPLAIHPPKLEVIIKALGSRLGIDGAADALPEFQAASYSDRASDAEFQIIDGMAVIPIEGTLIKKETWMSAWSGCTSYTEIQRQLAAAVNDSRVQGILLDIDSPGGEVTGCFELADYIYSLRGMKPLYAIANDCAASAAYAIASSADRIFVTRTGCVGSVGVFALHVDESGLDQQVGVKYTYIHAGDKKVDGNPHEPLSESAQSDMQTEVDREYEMFTALVSRNRKVSEKKIVGTEAGLYFGENALPMMADAVGTFDDAMSALRSVAGKTQVSNAASAANSTQGEPPMAKEVKAAADDEMDKPCGKSEAEPDPEDPDKKEEEDEDEMKKAAANAVTTINPGPSQSLTGGIVTNATIGTLSTAKEARSIEDIKAITALCKLGGCPEKAADFLAENKSVAEVSELLTTARVEESEKHMIDSHVNPNKGAARIQDLEAEAATFARQNKGVTKEQAFAKMLEANPEVYAAYRTQHNAKALLASLEAAGIQLNFRQ